MYNPTVKRGFTELKRQDDRSTIRVQNVRKSTRLLVTLFCRGFSKLTKKSNQIISKSPSNVKSQSTLGSSQQVAASWEHPPRPSQLMCPPSLYSSEAGDGQPSTNTRRVSKTGTNGCSDSKPSREVG